MSTKTNKIVVLTLVAVMCLSLALLCACQTPAESVTLDKTSATLNVGESITLSATVSPDKAVEHSVLQWSSSNEAVAKVENGKVTAMGKGTATITVAIAETELSATCNVEVLLPVGGVLLDQTQKVINYGESFQLTATVSPDGASNPAISWSSSNESVATVVDGLVTATGKGSAVITVTTADGGHTANCTVSVLMPVGGVEIEQDDAQLYAGKTLILSANVFPSNASNKNLSWASSDDNVATVNGGGIVTAVGRGTATITVTTEDGGFTDSITVTVLDFDTKPAELQAQAELAQGHVVVESPANSIATIASPIDGVLYFVMGDGNYSRSQIINHENAISVEVSQGDNMVLLPVASQSITQMQYVIVEKGEIATTTQTTDVLALQWTAEDFYVLPETGAITTWAELKEALKVDQDIVLGANIDAGGEEYAPTLSGYRHTFDGAGYYIFNLNIVASETNAGLFKTARTPAVFKDVTFVNATITANAENVGLLFGSNDEPANNVIQVSNVDVVNLKVQGESNKVGLVGWIKGASCDITFEYCDVEMKIVGYTGERVGGLIGLANYNSKISIVSCTSIISISEADSNYIGGLIGYADSSNMVISVEESVGLVQASASELNNVGGLFGRVNGPQVTISNTHGTVFAISCDNCTYFGGICGAVDGKAVLQVSAVQAQLVQNGSKVSRSGGFSGGALGSSTISISKSILSYVTDATGASDERNGGFVGQSDGSPVMTVENCQINVEINKNMVAFGGLIGAIDGQSKLHTNFVVLKMSVSATPGATNDAFGYYGGVAAEDGVLIKNTVLQSNYRSNADLIYGQLWNEPAAPVLENSPRQNLGESVGAELGELFVGEQNTGADFWTYDAQTGQLAPAK